MPDVTKKATLDHINYAINLCDTWDAALDVGCGNGHYIAALAAKFKHAVGVDIDIHSGQKILADTYPNITFFNGPIEKYAKSKHFDFVLLMDIFEHIVDIVPFMKQISHVQEAGGIVYIVTPNPIFCGPASQSDIFYKKSGYLGHIKHYTKNEVVDICRQAGYEVELSFYEETKLHAKLYTLMRGISRRERAFSQKKLYRLVRPIVLFLLKPIVSSIEKICFRNEMQHSNDIFATRSLCVIVKKQ